MPFGRRELTDEVVKRCAWWDIREGAEADVDTIGGRVLSAQEREQRGVLLKIAESDGHFLRRGVTPRITVLERVEFSDDDGVLRYGEVANGLGEEALPRLKGRLVCLPHKPRGEIRRCLGRVAVIATQPWMFHDSSERARGASWVRRRPVRWCKSVCGAPTLEVGYDDVVVAFVQLNHKEAISEKLTSRTSSLPSAKALQASVKPVFENA